MAWLLQMFGRIRKFTKILNIKEMISIWLSPSDSDMNFYQQINIALSKRFNTPIFEPHLTLQEDVSREWCDESFQQFLDIAQHRLPFDLDLQPLESKYRYFQCFYLKSLTGHFELIQLHLLSLDVFKITEMPFMPHLSLMYGHFDKKVIDSLINEYGDLLNRKVTFDKIKFVETGENVESWKVLKTLHIGNKKNEKTYLHNVPSLMF